MQFICLCLQDDLDLDDFLVDKDMQGDYPPDDRLPDLK